MFYENRFQGGGGEKRKRRYKNIFVLVLLIISFFSISILITIHPTNFETLHNSFHFIPGHWKHKLKDVWPFPSNQELTKGSPKELEKWAIKGSNGFYYPPTYSGYQNNTAPRAKAGFIVLVRNRELEGMREAMYDVEARFNRNYGYPWIFLNNEPFTEEFKKGVRKMTRSEIRFGLVPKEHWSYPDHINQTKAAETRIKMEKEGVFYGGSESYRHMCRFQSGFFFRHPLTLDLEYYWRVEPGTKIYCDLDYDPFLFMQMNNKTYGFTIALHEYKNSVETLYSTTQKFVEQNPQFIAKDAAFEFLTNSPTITNASTFSKQSQWNMCHFWSNFEIADLRLWRSEAYLNYFEFLDKQGGFFYERWGDAPIHSIAATLFQSKEKIHFFDDIGYLHKPRSRCPTNPKYHESGKCDCDPKVSFDKAQGSCLQNFWKATPEKEFMDIVP